MALISLSPILSAALLLTHRRAPPPPRTRGEGCMSAAAEDDLELFGELSEIPLDASMPNTDSFLSILQAYIAADQGTSGVFGEGCGPTAGADPDHLHHLPWHGGLTWHPRDTAASSCG
jgi:hypothetical protein